MSASRHNAPLVELIAELRWNPRLPEGSVVSAAPGAPELFIGDKEELEPGFARFAGAVASAGYTNVERLSPENFPLLIHQPATRHRGEGDAANSLYQIGPGVFSTNAVPPYQSWNEFSPLVQSGVQALLASREERDRHEPFFATSLRYIDAFDASYFGERSASDFLEQILGVKISLPNALTLNLIEGGQVTPALQLQLPMQNGMLMSFGFAEAMFKGKRAYMMDTAVSTTVAIGPEADSVMSSFHTAHEAIRSSFTALIEPISNLMPFKESQ